MPNLFVLLIVILLASVCLAAPASQPTTAKHFPETDDRPLIIPDPSQIKALRERVQSDPTTADVFRRDVLTVADETLQRQPRPINKIIYEGRPSGDAERNNSIDHLTDMPRIKALVWAAIITADDRYAQAAIQWTLAWAGTIQPSGNDVNDNKLDSIVLTACLLGDRMSDADRATLANWCRKLGQVQLKDIEKSHANRMAKRIKLVAAAGLVTGDDSLTQSAAEHLKAYVASQLRPDGQSLDLEARDALQYHVSGLKNILEAVFILHRAGQDLYGYEAANGSSIRKSVHYVNPFALGQQIHPEWVNTKVDLDRKRWQAGDEKYRPGRPWDPTQSLEMYQIAASFDRELLPVLEVVRKTAGTDRTWQDELLRQKD